MDLISALPDNLIEAILIKMPLLDAARTCILSKRWRYSWLKIPQLKLDAVFWQESLLSDIEGRSAEFSIILFRILLLHQGPITNITLKIPKLESPPEIDTFIAFIVRNGVEKCCLDMFPGGHYKLNSSLFNCPTLVDLYLRYCEVNFRSSTVERVRNLTRIALVDVIISVEALGSLVSSCPSLRTLHLKISIDLSCLEVNPPKLVEFLYYYSNSSKSSLAVNSQQHDSILKLLVKFPELKYLVMDGHYIKSLVAGLVPTSVSTGMLRCLKFIKLFDIYLEDVDQFSSVLCLIRSSPNLQKLEVNLKRRGLVSHIMENLQEEEDYSDLTLNHLVEVEVLSVAGNRLELKLIRILLEKFPSLRKMNIGLAIYSPDYRLKIIKEMFMFRRAAPNLEVNIKD